MDFFVYLQLLTTIILGVFSYVTIIIYLLRKKYIGIPGPRTKGFFFLLKFFLIIYKLEFLKNNWILFWTIFYYQQVFISKENDSRSSIRMDKNTWTYLCLSIFAQIFMCI